MSGFPFMTCGLCDLTLDKWGMMDGSNSVKCVKGLGVCRGVDLFLCNCCETKGKYVFISPSCCFALRLEFQKPQNILDVISQ